MIPQTLENLKELRLFVMELDFGSARHLDKAQVARLADCRWIHDGKNMLICGPCGTGKTFLASAFGNAACRCFLTVKSCRLSRILLDLQIGRGDGSWSKLLRELKKPDLLILDDFGLANLETLHCRDLLEVIDDRHGVASTLVVSQLPVSSWHGIFADTTIADAVLDRLLSGAHRFELTGPSLRRDRPAHEDAASLV